MPASSSRTSVAWDIAKWIWKCLESSAPIPLHPDLSLSSFDGFHFVREPHR
jgi:hypothetical protein